MQVEQPTVYVLDEMINSKTHRINLHHKWETRWADDHSAGLRVKRSGFKTRLGH